MRIAQIVPIWIPVPPVNMFGGVEIVVSDLIAGLQKRGHEVILYASGDSSAGNQVKSVISEAPLQSDWQAYKNFQLLNIVRAIEDSASYDVLHFHVSIDLFPIILSQFSKKPAIITIHNYEPGTPDDEVYKRYPNNSYVSVNKNSQKTFPDIKFIANVYHGINIDQYRYQEIKQCYMVYLSRIEEKKGILDAIEVAKQTGYPLKIMGPVSEKQQEFFEQKVRPQLNHNIEYFGPADLGMKNEILGNASVLLFPTKHNETFGLVAAEAMACGTPVIAYDYGALPEVVSDGDTGYVIERNASVEGLAAAVEKIMRLDNAGVVALSQQCRARVEECFTVDKMAASYEDIYRKLTNDQS